MKQKVCLTECIHYITDIPKEELNEAIYWKNNWPFDWVKNTFSLVEKYWFKIKELDKSKWQCIAILDKYKWDKITKKWAHAVIWNSWIELNPYAINIENYRPSYFWKIVKDN